uniref:Uncharacterized protein n=1 Tax=Myotis myotis TaxID=51298 RepID=A0A7J7WWI1_MYOMY|nr:hypothetical protein mMyoMyo1_011987 [Myotis myotis]
MWYVFPSLSYIQQPPKTGRPASSMGGIGQLSQGLLLESSHIFHPVILGMCTCPIGPLSPQGGKVWTCRVAGGGILGNLIWVQIQATVSNPPLPAIKLIAGSLPGCPCCSPSRFLEFRKRVMPVKPRVCAMGYPHMMM